MRIATMVICLFAATTFFLNPNTGEQRVDFHYNTFEGVFEQARAEGKLVFIDCYTSWCGPCKKMDREVFAHPIVANYLNDKYVCVKADMDSRFGKSLDRQLNINSYPTLLFVDAEGKVVKKQVGYMDSNQFLGLAQATWMAN